MIPTINKVSKFKFDSSCIRSPVIRPTVRVTRRRRRVDCNINPSMITFLT